MAFTGKAVQVQDKLPCEVVLHVDGQKEVYRFKRPKMVVGNIVIGERFIEPQGTATILNIGTGDECVITFKPRSFFTGKNMHEIVAAIKDPTGNVAYTLEGNFTESISLFD